jgi:hypothetical protein
VAQSFVLKKCKEFFDLDPAKNDLNTAMKALFLKSAISLKFQHLEHQISSDRMVSVRKTVTRGRLDRDCSGNDQHQISA